MGVGQVKDRRPFDYKPASAQPPESLLDFLKKNGPPQALADTGAAGWDSPSEEIPRTRIADNGRGQTPSDAAERTSQAPTVALPAKRVEETRQSVSGEQGGKMTVADEGGAAPGQQQPPPLSPIAQKVYKSAIAAAEWMQKPAGSPSQSQARNSKALGAVLDAQAQSRAHIEAFSKALGAVSDARNHPEALSAAIGKMTPGQAASFVAALREPRDLYPDTQRLQLIAQARQQILSSLNAAPQTPAAGAAVQRVYADTLPGDVIMHQPQLKSDLAAGIARSWYPGAASNLAEAQKMQADQERLEGLFNSREGRQLLLFGSLEKRFTALEAIRQNPSITANSLNRTGKNPEQSPLMAKAIAEVITPEDMPNRQQEVERRQGLLSTQEGQELLLGEHSSSDANKAAVRNFVLSNPKITAATLTSSQSHDLWQHFNDPYANPAVIAPMMQQRLAQPDGKPLNDKGEVFSETGLKNFAGSAMGFKPALPGNMSAEEAMANGELSLYDNSEHAKDVEAVTRKIHELGGDNAKVTALPVTFSSRTTGPVEVPLFRVETEDGDKYVDNQGNGYKSFDDWKQHNKLPSGLMVYPENGHLQTGESGQLALASGDTPNTDNTRGKQAITALDHGALVGGIAFGGPVAWAAASWGAYRAGGELYTLYDRGQSLNPLTNADARANEMGLAAFGLGGFAGAGGRVLSKIGALETGAGRLALAYTNVAAATFNTAAVVNSGADAIQNWDKMSESQRALAVLQFGFFGKMSASHMAGGYNALRSEFAAQRLAYEQGMNAKLGSQFGTNGARFESGSTMGQASDFGLPSRTPLVANPAIEGNGMRVAYDLDNSGQPINTRIEFNPNVTPQWRDLSLHANVARQIGRTGSLRERIGQWFKGQDQIKPGSLGWETRHEVNKLGAKVSQLSRELNPGGLTPQRRAEIEGQLSDLDGQISHYEGLAGKADALGRGYVAQDDDATKLAEVQSATHQQLATTVQTNFANERSQRIDDVIAGNEFKALNIDENSATLVKDAVLAASNESIKHKYIEGFDDKGFTARLMEKLDTIGLPESINTQNLTGLFNQIPKFNFQRFSGSVEYVQAERQTELKAAFDNFQTIGAIDPQVLTMDIDAPHPMNTGSYIRHRLPDNMIDMARRELPESMVALLKSNSSNRLEFFVGNEKDMLDYYTGVKGLDHVGEFNSPTSTQFNLFAHPKNDNEFIVVASGMASNARIAHQSYQFKFAGIDVSQVPIRGEIRSLVHDDVAALKADLAELSKGNEDAVVFIGSRKAVLNTLSPGTHLDAKKAGTFRFSHILTNDGNTSYTGLRMPNGDLAYHATEAVLEAGFRDIVMVGAGGAFPAEYNGFIRKDADVTKVGQYQVVTSATMNGDTIDIASVEGVTIRDIKAGGTINRMDGRNVTVNSPLEENDAWYNAKSRKFSSVDVETYHIFRAIKDFLRKHPGEKITLLPGLFSSDILKAHPLDQKINLDNAYKNLGEFLSQSEIQ